MDYSKILKKIDKLSKELYSTQEKQKEILDKIIKEVKDVQNELNGIVNEYRKENYFKTIDDVVKAYMKKYEKYYRGSEKSEIYPIWIRDVVIDPHGRYVRVGLHGKIAHIFKLSSYLILCEGKMIWNGDGSSKWEDKNIIGKKGLAVLLYRNRDEKTTEDVIAESRLKHHFDPNYSIIQLLAEDGEKVVEIEPYLIDEKGRLKIGDVKKEYITDIDLVDL